MCVSKNVIYILHATFTIKHFLNSFMQLTWLNMLLPQIKDTIKKHCETLQQIITSNTLRKLKLYPAPF